MKTEKNWHLITNNKSKMKQVFFLMLLLISLLSSSQNASRDSIWSCDKKEINSNTYYFIRHSTESWQTLLKIVLVKGKDSTTVLEVDDSYHSGDCNGSTSMAGSYKIENNFLILHNYQVYDEHFDDRYHHYSSSTSKETYAIQKKGSIVRLKTEYGKNDKELNKSIKEMLRDKMDEQYNRN